MGQILLSKGVMGLMMKAPAFCRGFFDSYSIVEDWRKLFCNGDVVYFVGFGWFLGLTLEFTVVLDDFSFK